MIAVLGVIRVVGVVSDSLRDGLVIMPFGRRRAGHLCHRMVPVMHVSGVLIDGRRWIGKGPSLCTPHRCQFGRDAGAGREQPT